MKQISVKQAQKWLDKLKTEDIQAYKDITKFLRKYEKTQDELDCFIKINTTLLNHPKLVDQLNTFMQDGNKMIVDKEQQQKIKELMAYMKKNKPQIFSKIIIIIQQMSTKNGMDAQQMNHQLKIHIKQTVKDDPQLKKITEEALQRTGEQLISRLNLEHLKNTNKSPNLMPEEIEEQGSKIKNINQKDQKVVFKKEINNNKIQFEKQIQATAKPQKKIPFSTINEVQQQKYIFRHLQKTLQRKIYLQVVKILKIYFLNIITKNETIQMVNTLQLDEQLQFLRDIIESRQSDRRRLSLFKPLNDLDFSNCQRPSPSYSLMPNSYPNRCAGRNEFFKKILNDVYVSVPHGSQQNFNVRFKNANQLNLLKSEDERYEFDLYMMRLNKTYMMLTQILNPHSKLSNQKIHYMLQKIISMGTIQLIYKNCNRQQKQQLQWYLKLNQQETLKILKDRIHIQIKEMQSIKSIHALKAWQDVAHKNFTKALDLKGFQFKKNQKERMKSTYFVTELHQRVSILLNAGQSKQILMVPFEDKKQFFTVLNSFEASSRTEKCFKRLLPQVKSYDLQNQQKRKFYPAVILAFQNNQVRQKVYSLILFYIDTFNMADSEKLKCKNFLENFLINFLGWQLPVKRYLNQLYDEQKLYQKIYNDLQQKINFSSWISQSQQGKNEQSDKQQNVSKFNSLEDQSSPYIYLPQKSISNKILYGSEQLYAFLRFIYTLYERVTKLMQVADSQQKINLFEILFYACIKVKQGMKFQQNLNILFGKYAYLFSTIYKLCDNLIRALVTVANCVITTQSIKLSKAGSEQIYLLLLNKFCLNNQLSNNKIIRLAYEPKQTLIYINLLESFYKVDDNSKELLRKRMQISRGIDIYTVHSWYDSEPKKKRKINQILQSSNQQYLFQSSTIKMINHKEKQDIFCFIGKSNAFTKNLKKQLKRVSKINEHLN